MLGQITTLFDVGGTIGEMLVYSTVDESAPSVRNNRCLNTIVESRYKLETI